MMAKKEELDEETMALINWCIEVEKFLVAGGATLAEAQDHIEEQVEWFTDQFYLCMHGAIVHMLVCCWQLQCDCAVAQVSSRQRRLIRWCANTFLNTRIVRVVSALAS